MARSPELSQLFSYLLPHPSAASVICVWTRTSVSVGGEGGVG